MKALKEGSKSWNYSTNCWDVVEGEVPKLEAELAELKKQYEEVEVESWIQKEMDLAQS